MRALAMHGERKAIRLTWLLAQQWPPPQKKKKKLKLYQLL